MKIFIWEGVLVDYTDGMAIAYAETCEQAFQMFDEMFDEVTRDNLGPPSKVIDCEKDTTPFAAHVWGGS